MNSADPTRVLRGISGQVLTGQRPAWAPAGLARRGGGPNGAREGDDRLQRRAGRRGDAAAQAADHAEADGGDFSDEAVVSPVWRRCASHEHIENIDRAGCQVFCGSLGWGGPAEGASPRCRLWRSPISSQRHVQLRPCPVLRGTREALGAAERCESACRRRVEGRSPVAFSRRTSPCIDAVKGEWAGFGGRCGRWRPGLTWGGTGQGGP